VWKFPHAVFLFLPAAIETRKSVASWHNRWITPWLVLRRLVLLQLVLRQLVLRQLVLRQLVLRQLVLRPLVLRQLVLRRLVLRQLVFQRQKHYCRYQLCLSRQLELSYRLMCQRAAELVAHNQQ
jgi:hypothetical protein